jgi:hypothetical protein
VLALTAAYHIIVHQNPRKEKPYFMVYKNKTHPKVRKKEIKKEGFPSFFMKLWITPAP